MYRFNASNLSFYPYAFEDDYRASGTWPESGVDVSDFVFADFKQTTPPEGMQLGATADGKPCWVPVPPPTDEELAMIAEANRKLLLDRVDSISVVAWNSMTEEDQSSWIDYRKALVALPATKTWPKKVTWPVMPEMPQ